MFNKKKKQMPEVYTEAEMGSVETHIAARFGEFSNVFHEIVSRTSTVHLRHFMSSARASGNVAGRRRSIPAISVAELAFMAKTCYTMRNIRKGVSTSIVNIIAAQEAAMVAAAAST